MRISNSYSCLQKRAREDEEPSSRKSSRRGDSAPQLSRFANISTHNSTDTTKGTFTLNTDTYTQPLQPLETVTVTTVITTPLVQEPLLLQTQIDIDTHIDTHSSTSSTANTIMSHHPSVSVSASTLQQAFSANCNCDYSSSSCSENEDYSDNESTIKDNDTTVQNNEHESCNSTSTVTSRAEDTETHIHTKPLAPSQDSSSIISELDMQNQQTKNKLRGISPDKFVQKLFHAMLRYAPITRRTLELAPIILQSSSTNGTVTGKPFIPPLSENDLANYDVDVVAATREEDLQTLSDLHHKQGRSLSCCNRYGESLLHMACRRGFFPIVSFLTQEAGVAIRITDDCGRTPLHDALWHRDCQYATVDLLIRKDPSLLLMCDKHGHTPFSYARREHWEVWKQFLWDRREHIMQALDHDVMELFRFKI